MANDAQPEGYITVREAFSRLLDAWRMFNRDQDTQGHNQHTRMGQFRQALAAGELVAKVFPKGGIMELPTVVWKQSAFPERVFFEDEIEATASEGWRPYASRTPFLDRGHFDRWLQENDLPARRRRAIGQGYLSPDEALNWLLWQDHRGDTMERWIEASLGNGVRTLVPFSQAKDTFLGLLLTEDDFAVCTDPFTGQTHPIGKAEFSSPTLLHTDSGHVVSHKSRDGEHEIGRGHWNLLRVNAEHLIDSTAPGAMFHHKRPTPTMVRLDRTVMNADWLEAALWVGNQGQDGEVPNDAFEVGTAKLIAALFSKKQKARGIFRASTPEVEGHGYSTEIPAGTWEGAVLVEDPSQSFDRPRVHLSIEKDKTGGRTTPAATALICIFRAARSPHGFR